MGLDPANTLQIGIGITAFLATIASVFVFSIAYRERVARYLGYSLLFFGLWGWFGFAFYIPENLFLAREFRLVAIVFQIIAQIFSVQFCFAYLEEYRPLTYRERILYWILIGGNALFLLLYTSDIFGTRFLAGDVYPTATGSVLAPEPGPLALWFLAFYVVFAISCGIMILQRALYEEDSKRRAAFIFAISVMLSYLMGTTGWLTWYQIESPLAYLRGLAIPSYIVAMFYSITNYRLFNMRVAAAEVFVFALWGFLFLRVMLHDSLQSALPDIVILCAVVAIGLFLIRNVTRELAARIELETLTDTLHSLNTSLDAKVNERTRELSAAREHVESLVAQLPIGLIEVTPDGMIIRANASARAMVGPACAESSSISTCPLLSPHFPNGVVPGTVVVQTSGATPRDLEITTSPLTLDSGTGFALIVSDVTEHHALERAKDQFLATAAHQLRTPLSALKWTFNLLSEASLSDSEHALVASGAKGVENMEQIAEDLMQSARTTSGSGIYHFTKGDVTSAVEAALAVAKPLADKKRLAITMTRDSQLPPVLLDEKYLQSALQNLLDNAIKYTPDGGQIAVSLRSEADDVHIGISDTGIGMDQEEIRHAFERFFRGKRATALFANGTGLGLSIAKDIVTAHKGTITLSSTTGSGTTFHITLPRSS